MNKIDVSATNNGRQIISPSYTSVAVMYIPSNRIKFISVFILFF